MSMPELSKENDQRVIIAYETPSGQQFADSDDFGLRVLGALGQSSNDYCEYNGKLPETMWVKTDDSEDGLQIAFNEPYIGDDGDLTFDYCVKELSPNGEVKRETDWLQTRLVKGVSESNDIVGYELAHPKTKVTNVVVLYRHDISWAKDETAKILNRIDSLGIWDDDPSVSFVKVEDDALLNVPLTSPKLTGRIHEIIALTATTDEILVLSELNPELVAKHANNRNTFHFKLIPGLVDHASAQFLSQGDFKQMLSGEQTALVLIEGQMPNPIGSAYDTIVGNPLVTTILGGLLGGCAILS